LRPSVICRSSAEMRQIFSVSRLIRRANWVSTLFAWERQSLLLEPAVPLKSAPNRFRAPPPDNLVMQPEKITYGWWRVSQSEMVISYIILLYYWIVRDILKGSIEQLAQNLKIFPQFLGQLWLMQIWQFCKSLAIISNRHSGCNFDLLSYQLRLPCRHISLYIFDRGLNVQRLL